jgi:DNA repair exonuclease SbcCD ATPase subunit
VEERLRGADERTKSAEERVRAAEERARAADEKLRQGEEKSRALQERVRAAEEQARSFEAAAQAAAVEHESDVAKLEAQLRERGREIKALRDEVDRRDKLVRELVMTNFPPAGMVASNGGALAENGSRDGSHGLAPDQVGDPGQVDAMVADLSARLDRMASDAARREADLVGARWRIAQLERELTPQR